MTEPPVPSTNFALMEDGLRDAWHSFRQDGWRFAQLLAAAASDWGYAKLRQWCEAELSMAASTVSRFVAAGEFLRTRDSDKPDWLAVPVWDAMEALPLAQTEPEQALAIVQEHRTQAAIRAAVRECQPDMHHDTSGTRQIRATVTANVLHDWQIACNIIRAHLGTNGLAYPTDSDIIQAICTVVMQAPELAIPEKYRAEVESGNARCFLCKSYAALEQHHRKPRSLGGGKGETCWLCHNCHRNVTDRVNGFGWEELNTRLEGQA